VRHEIGLGVEAERNSPVTGKGHVVGVDLGGTSVRAALAAQDGTIEAEAYASTDIVDDRVVPQLLSLITEVSEKAGRRPEDLVAAVIGVPGVPDNSAGMVRNAPNVPALARPSAIGALRSRLPIVPRFENDVNLAALAEWQFGGHDCESVAALALGTGIGLGIVIRGEIVRGEHQAAGEIAALPFGGDPFSTSGIGRGLESVVGAPALVAAYLGTGDRRLRTGAQVFAAARQGDVEARQVVDNYARDVARAVMTVLAVLDPGVIALTGGIGSDPYLHGAVTEWLERGGARPEVLVGSKLGARAGLIGAIVASVADARKTDNPIPVP
jgi:predicted NBD/HSP70 family sugar kinase